MSVERFLLVPDVTLTIDGVSHGATGHGRCRKQLRRPGSNPVFCHHPKLTRHNGAVPLCLVNRDACYQAAGASSRSRCYNCRRCGPPASRHPAWWVETSWLMRSCAAGRAPVSVDEPSKTILVCIKGILASCPLKSDALRPASPRFDMRQGCTEADAPLSPLIGLDPPERCILCARCVRYFGDGSQGVGFSFANRPDWEIISNPELSLTRGFSRRDRYLPFGRRTDEVMTSASPGASGS